MNVIQAPCGRVKVNGSYAVKVEGQIFIGYSTAERLCGLPSASISNQMTTRTGNGRGKAHLAVTAAGRTVTHPTMDEVLDFLTAPSYSL